MRSLECHQCERADSDVLLNCKLPDPPLQRHSSPLLQGLFRGQVRGQLWRNLTLPRVRLDSGVVVDHLIAVPDESLQNVVHCLLAQPRQLRHTGKGQLDLTEVS